MIEIVIMMKLNIDMNDVYGHELIMMQIVMMMELNIDMNDCYGHELIMK